MEENKYEKKIVTIPNALSVVRLLLLPVIFWLYCVKEEPIWTAVAMVLSGVTDLADGYIARHFHMISNLGKILDPIADKLTQGVVMLCLVVKFPLMLLPLIALIVKDTLNGVLGLLVIRKTGKVYGADWHGKINTCVIYATMMLHILWIHIPTIVSRVSIGVCLGMMALSMVLYIVKNVKLLRAAKEKE